MTTLLTEGRWERVKKILNTMKRDRGVDPPSRPPSHPVPLGWAFSILIPTFQRRGLRRTRQGHARAGLPAQDCLVSAENREKFLTLFTLNDVCAEGQCSLRPVLSPPAPPPFRMLGRAFPRDWGYDFRGFFLTVQNHPSLPPC